MPKSSLYTMTAGAAELIMVGHRYVTGHPRPADFGYCAREDSPVSVKNSPDPQKAG